MDKPKILIIEDDPTTCSLLETILNMENYRPSSVTEINQQGIIPLLERHSPNILILDFYLGSQNTLAHMATIRQDPTWQQLLVLMTSAIDRRKECKAAGANAFILKPFKWDDIIAIVATLRDDLAYQEA